MANWSNPTLTSLYTDFVTEVKNRDVDLALGLDPATTSPTNVPANAIRWNSASFKYQKWDGSTWNDLSAKYIFTAVEVSGSTVPVNGMYLSTTNTLNFSTASTASRLTIDGNGNVNIDSGTFYVDAVGNRTGVNNTSPGSYNAAADDLVVGLTGDTGVTIASTNQGSIFFADGTTGGAQQSAGYLYYLHSNDSMGFGTANTLRMTLDASGNLGLGVVPSAWGASFKVLDFAGASFASNTAGTATFIAQNAYYDFAWKYKSSTNATLFQTDSGSFQWYTSTNTPSVNGAITFTQVMTLDASGNLGIKNTSPTSYNASADDLVVGLTGDTGVTIVSGTSNQGSIFFADGTTGGTQQAAGYLYYLHSNDSMVLGTANSPRLTITSGGLVGIGTTAPYASLEVQGTQQTHTGVSSQVGPITAYNTTNNADTAAVRTVLSLMRAGKSGVSYGSQANFNIGRYSQANAYANTQLNLRLANGVTNDPDNDVMTWLGDGRVGIGTTSPSTILEASQTTGTRIRSSYTNTSGGRDAGFEIYGDISGGFGVRSSLTYAGNSGVTSLTASLDLALSTGGSEQCRIDSSGRLLVGTSSARANFFNSSVTSTLQIEDQLGLASITRNANDVFGGTLVLAKNRGGANTVVQSGDTVSALSFQGNDGSEFVEAANISVVVDATPGANDMPGRLVFSTTADGEASPTERLRLDSTGRLLHIGGGSAASPAVQFNGSAPSNSLVVGSAGAISTTASVASITLNGTNTSGLIQRGGQVIFTGKNAAGTQKTAAYISADLSTTTTTQEGGDLSLFTMNPAGSGTGTSALTEVMRLNSIGTASFAGAAGNMASPVVQFHGNAGAGSLLIDSSGYITSKSGRIPAKQYYRLDSARNGVNQAAAQSVFGVGVTLVGSTVYEFEALYWLQCSNASGSPTMNFLFGGTATLNNIMYSGVGPGSTSVLPPASFYDAAPTSFITNVATASTVSGTLTSAVSVVYLIKGTVSVNAGGTFIPQYSFDVAPGNLFTTNAGSYFSIWPLAASGAAVNIGSWA